MERATVLVTGGAGYVGSHISLFFYKKGYQVIILDDFSCGTFKPSWATCIEADIANDKMVANIFKTTKIDAVIHCASFTEKSRSSFKNPSDFYVNNVGKTIRLLEIMVDHGVRNFIFSSSSLVYGIPETIPISECHPCAPVSPYGKTKYFIESIIDDFSHAYDFSFVSLRYFNVSGALPEYKTDAWALQLPRSSIALLLHKVIFKQPLLIHGVDYDTPDGTYIDDYVHVWDVAQATYLALKHLKKDHPSDLFNIGSGMGYSVKQLISIIKDLTQTLSCKIINGDKKCEVPAKIIADPSKAQNILQWKPLGLNIEEIIQSEIRSLSSNNANRKC